MIDCLSKIDVPDFRKYFESDIIPFMDAEFFDRRVYIFIIEFKAGIVRANPLQPVIEDLPRVIEVIIGAHIEKNRIFRVIEIFDVIKVLI